MRRQRGGRANRAGMLLAVGVMAGILAAGAITQYGEHGFQRLPPEETETTSETERETQSGPVLTEETDNLFQMLEARRMPSPAVEQEELKIIGYLPYWKLGGDSEIRYDVLTHLIYAFAIPTADGSLREPDDPEAVREMVQEAHKNGIQVLAAIGGWSYEGIPLEDTFCSAVSTEERRDRLTASILEFCREYNFDGVDMDWEYPRVEDGSSLLYEQMMLDLAEQLHREGKVLTCAVAGGALPDRTVFPLAGGQSDAVLEAADWIHVMAYDGGSGEDHSTYQFAVDCANYWLKFREVPGEKVILGVPFYSRPSWKGYGELVELEEDAWRSDRCMAEGEDAWYNGVETMRKKAAYARDYLGGIMIWEITQDTEEREKSLLEAIREVMEP